jgi:hypothetical protein
MQAKYKISIKIFSGKNAKPANHSKMKEGKILFLRSGQNKR